MNKTVSEKIASDILENYLKGLEVRGVIPNMGESLRDVYEAMVGHIKEGLE